MIFLVLQSEDPVGNKHAPVVGYSGNQHRNAHHRQQRDVVVFRYHAHCESKDDADEQNKKVTDQMKMLSCLIRESHLLMTVAAGNDFFDVF